jgi:flagellar biosynthesis protein FlgN
MQQMRKHSDLDPTLARQHMEQLLDDEGRNLGQLESLLVSEHALLEGSDVEALERAGNARQTCIAELLRIDDERRSLCRMLDFPTDLDGLRKLLKWCDPANGLLSRWTACMQKAAQCRQLNERNGALVAAKLKRVEGLLGLLTGRDRSASIYSPQGSYTRQPAGHTLAQA